MGWCSSEDREQTDREIEQQPDEETRNTVQTCPQNAVQINIALTIDDGPRTGITDSIASFLVSESVPATWYIVKSNLDSMPSGYIDTIRSRVRDDGHEIAIHEALPTAAASSDVVSPETIDDNTEHVAPLPTRSHNRYRSLSDWAQHLANFKQELVNRGLTITFYRPPGGLLTEISEMMTFYGNNGSARDIIPWINENYKSGRTVSPADRRAALFRIIGSANRGDIFDTLNEFITTLSTTSLLLWGSDKILGSARRNAANERQIVLNHWGVQSWFAEIAPSRNNAIQKLERRFRRRTSATTVDDTVAPYLVILTHDNSGYLSHIQRTIKEMKSHPRVQNDEFCLNFVTMSELRRLVSSDPLNR